MTNLKTIAVQQPPHPFEAYSHVVGPLTQADGGGYLFTIPDLPGVMADGDTEAAASADGREAFGVWTSALFDMGRVMPAPTLTAQDFASAEASGRFVARLPRSMHARLAARAKSEGVSLNTLVVTMIAEGMGQRAG